MCIHVHQFKKQLFTFSSLKVALSSCFCEHVPVFDVINPQSQQGDGELILVWLFLVLKVLEKLFC